MPAIDPSASPAAAAPEAAWPLRIGLVGYGEVGRLLAEDLRAAGHAVSAYDLKLESPSSEADTMRVHAVAHGVELTTSATMVATPADLVISAVTAGRTVDAARGLAAGLKAGTFVLDLNAASPEARRDAAEAVDAQGGRYVEGALMTGVTAHRARLPLLLGGAHAAALKPLLDRLGFIATVHDVELGPASATALCRSILTKGMEALLIESLLTARHHGVDDAVLASLQETWPGIDWRQQAGQAFRRAIRHGGRRSEELREAAVTVAQAGLTPWAAQAAAERQAWISALQSADIFGPLDAQAADPGPVPDWRDDADRLLAHLAKADRP